MDKVWGFQKAVWPWIKFIASHQFELWRENVINIFKFHFNKLRMKLKEGDVLLLENNQRCGGVMQSGVSYCSRPKVNYCPKMARHNVFYSSYSSAVCQQLEFLFNKEWHKHFMRIYCSYISCCWTFGETEMGSCYCLRYRSLVPGSVSSPLFFFFFFSSLS